MAGDDLQDFRIEALERNVGEMRDAVKSIDQSLKTLASLEVRHAETRDALGRAFKDIEDHEKRLRDIERDMPTFRMVKGWIVSGVLGVLGLVGAAVWKVVFGG